MASLGHPCKFQWVSRLGSVTARHSSSGRQPNFAALNRGCHLYSSGRPSRWALAHILVIVRLHCSTIYVDVAYCYRQEGHLACKKMGDDGGGHWLVQMEWLPAGWSVCLPLLIFPCTMKSRSSLCHQLTRVVPEKGRKTVVVCSSRGGQ